MQYINPPSNAPKNVFHKTCSDRWNRDILQSSEIHSKDRKHASRTLYDHEKVPAHFSEEMGVKSNIMAAPS